MEGVRPEPPDKARTRIPLIDWPHVTLQVRVVLEELSFVKWRFNEYICSSYVPQKKERGTKLVYVRSE